MWGYRNNNSFIFTLLLRSISPTVDSMVTKCGVTFEISVFGLISRFVNLYTFSALEFGELIARSIHCLVNQSFPEKKLAAISQTTFSNAFSLMKKLFLLLKFHWSLFLRTQLTITIKIALKLVPKGLSNSIPALVLIMAWHRPWDKPLY